MDTERIERVICKMDKLDFGYWDDESETFISLENDSDAVKEYLGLDDRFMSSLIMFVADIKELIGGDLEDIWMRLDDVERKAFE